MTAQSYISYRERFMAYEAEKKHLICKNLTWEQYQLELKKLAEKYEL